MEDLFIKYALIYMASVTILGLVTFMIYSFIRYAWKSEQQQRGGCPKSFSGLHNYEHVCITHRETTKIARRTRSNERCKNCGKTISVSSSEPIYDAEAVNRILGL